MGDLVLAAASVRPTSTPRGGMPPGRPQRAALAPVVRAEDQGQGAKESTFVESRTIETVDGTRHTLDPLAEGGVIEITALTVDGSPTFTPLKRNRRTRPTDKVGTFRWYNHHRLPEHLGGGALTVRLHGNDDDRPKRFNRAENVRPIPPADPDFKGLDKRRNDAESINRALDDTMWLRRAHSVGHGRQHLNLLTHASASTPRRAPATAQQRPPLDSAA